MTAVYRPNLYPTYNNHHHKANWCAPYDTCNNNWGHRGNAWGHNRHAHYGHGHRAPQGWYNGANLWGAGRPAWGRGHDTNVINIINNLSSTAIANSSSTSNVKNVW